MGGRVGRDRVRRVLRLVRQVLQPGRGGNGLVQGSRVKVLRVVQSHGQVHQRDDAVVALRRREQDGHPSPKLVVHSAASLERDGLWLHLANMGGVSGKSAPLV